MKLYQSEKGEPSNCRARLSESQPLCAAAVATRSPDRTSTRRWAMALRRVLVGDSTRRDERQAPLTRSARISNDHRFSECSAPRIGFSVSPSFHALACLGSRRNPVLTLIAVERAATDRQFSGHYRTCVRTVEPVVHLRNFAPIVGLRELGRARRTGTPRVRRTRSPKSRTTSPLRSTANSPSTASQSGSILWPVGR